MPGSRDSHTRGVLLDVRAHDIAHDAQRFGRHVRGPRAFAHPLAVLLVVMLAPLLASVAAAHQQRGDLARLRLQQRVGAQRIRHRAPFGRRGGIPGANAGGGADLGYLGVVDTAAEAGQAWFVAGEAEARAEQPPVAQLYVAQAAGVDGGVEERIEQEQGVEIAVGSQEGGVEALHAHLVHLYLWGGEQRRVSFVRNLWRRRSRGLGKGGGGRLGGGICVCVRARALTLCERMYVCMRANA